MKILVIREDFIRLDALLKLAGLVGTGGEAKVRITTGEVRVNGVVCTMRGKKIRPGDMVETNGGTLTVRSDAS